MTGILPGIDYLVRKPELSQWYTPPQLAQRIVDWAIDFRTHRSLKVLEPSAGDGALVKALVARGCIVAAVDIDRDNVARLQGIGATIVIHDNFLMLQPEVLGGVLDLVVMNPPFEDGQTEEHVLHALKFAQRVVCHCPLTTLAGKDRKEGLWREAYLKRLAICGTRPKYGGSGGGMTDMCTIEIVRRPERVDLSSVRSSGISVEWW